MTKKKNTKMKEARATLPAPAAAEAPQPTPTPNKAAPEPAVVMMDPVGMRTPESWRRRSGLARPVGPLDWVAVLVRGVSYTVSYVNGPLRFLKGEPVRINASELERLQLAVDHIDFEDVGTGVRIRRSIRKFSFTHLDSGKAVALDPIPDQECGPFARTEAEQQAHDRKFEGSEFTPRS